MITAVLNQVDKLEVTIQSVLAQSYDDLDYIVIDGGSTDGTVDVVRTYANRLKCWLSEPDEGVYHAMNKGWSLADPASWVLYLGAGDKLISLPDEIDCDAENPVVVYGNVQLEGGRTFYAHSGFRLRLYNSIHHQSLLVPKGLHPDPPFNLDFQFYADFDFNQRLSLNGAVFRFEPHLSAFAAPGGMTSEVDLDELIRIVHKNYGLFWSVLSSSGFALARLLPALHRFRPIK